MARKKIRKPASIEQWNNAHASVGRFLFHWAGLEQVLHDALETALDLDPVRIAILVGNIQLRDKLNILKTFAHLLGHPKAKDVIKLLDAIGTYSTTRNMMAHDFHIAHGNDVQFFRIKAKGRFDLPTPIWTDEDFEDAYDRIEAFEKALLAQTHVFKTRVKTPVNALAIGLPAGQASRRRRSHRTQ